MPDFESLEYQLNAANVTLSPAEAQGLLCGLLCHSGKDVRAHWISELLEEECIDSSLEKLQASLGKLYIETSAAMQDQEFSFNPLLPDDKRPISERGQGLCDWCQGFLYGIGLSGKKLEKALSELGREGLKDLTEVTRMDINALDASNENEEAFMELAEFLRVAVLTIYSDLATQRNQAQ